MEESKHLEWLLECLIHVVGRAAVKADEVRVVVGNRAKQIRAFNLCDGTLTQAAIAKKAGLNSGNFSRSLDRWVNNGVMFRFDEGKEVRPLHIYPIPTNAVLRRKAKRKVRR